MASPIQVVYEAEEDLPEVQDSSQKLVHWIISRTSQWADDRDNNYKDKWKEYYRLWRGIWSSEDKTRDSERSRLISPATAQAVEVATSEIEEAVFGRGKWFDIEDDFEDQQTEDIYPLRNKMIEDLEAAGVPSSMATAFLNGAIYGTGIAKVVVEVSEDRSPVASPYGMDMEVNQKVQVRLVPVEPDEFIIDPAATSIQDALGVAHEVMVPKHIIEEKQAKGIYRNVEVTPQNDDRDLAKDEILLTDDADEVKIIEWHGLVPAGWLDIELAEDEEIEDLGYDVVEEYDLVEAIVTIANDHILLRAVENPYTMKDRCFIAYQHDTVPNQFWGRGIVEKGYNTQKALDAELRGRIDAMALAIHPMVGMDSTRLPRGMDTSVRPGKTFLTNGNPAEAIMPFNLGNIGTNTFQQGGELERMHQMATGAMDSAAPVGVSPRNSTLGGMSIMQASSIKRSKRTLKNIEDNFINPFIKMAAYRFMQFAPRRYPIRDYKFTSNSTLGIMARELEQQQLTSLLQTVQPDSPAYWMLIRGIYNNSSIDNREQMIQYADYMLQQSMQPKPDPKVALDQQKFEHSKNLDVMRLKVEMTRAETERMRVQIEQMKAMPEIDKTKQEAILKQIEGNLAIREQDLKEREVEIKALESTNNQQIARITAEAPPQPPAPSVVVNPPSKRKKITVERTENGLVGESEEIE